MMTHCCAMMKNATLLKCDIHKDIYACPDVLISYTEKYAAYGIIVHDGGSSSITIHYCPWCGSRVGK
jgi:hypothetical protein